MPFNRKTHPVLGVIRPRFKLLSSMSEEEVFRLLAEKTSADSSVKGKEVGDQFYLDIPKNEQHYWSPELKVSVEKNEEGPGSLIRCLVGPRQAVWLMFVFIYTFLGVLSLFGGMYGMVQLDLGKPSIWVWCFPVTLVVIIGVYLTAQFGQHKGRDQTLHLVSVLYHALEEGNLQRI